MSEPIYEGTASFVRTQPFYFCLSVLLVPLGIGIIMLAHGFIVNRSKKLTIFPGELHYEEGIFSKSGTELRLEGIRTVKVSQSLSDRIFGVGKLEIYTAGDSPEVSVAGLADPESVKQLLREQADA